MPHNENMKQNFEICMVEHHPINLPDPRYNLTNQNKMLTSETI